MKKKLIAKLLVLAMVLSIVPVAFAAGGAGDVTNPTNTESPAPESPAPETPKKNTPYPYSVSVDTTVHAGTNVTAADVKVEGGNSVELEAKVTDGKAVLTLDTKAVDALSEQTTGDELVLTIKAAGATKVETALPGEALANLAEKTGAALTIKSPVATVTIPNDAMVAQFKDVGTVKVSVQASGSNVGFSIQASGRSLQTIKGLTVEF